jgi:hypothetical protein
VLWGLRGAVSGSWGSGGHVVQSFTTEEETEPLDGEPLVSAYQMSNDRDKVSSGFTWGLTCLP